MTALLRPCPTRCCCRSRPFCRSCPGWQSPFCSSACFGRYFAARGCGSTATIVGGISAAVGGCAAGQYRSSTRSTGRFWMKSCPRLGWSCRCYCTQCHRSFVAAGLLGLARSVSFDRNRGVRVPWFCAFHRGRCPRRAWPWRNWRRYYWCELCGRRYPTEFFSTAHPVRAASWSDPCPRHFHLFGLLTGLCMKWLLTRRLRQRRAALVGQFE